MTRAGAITLLLGAVAFYTFFHFVFGVEAFTLFQIFFIKTIAFLKGVIARLTWEVVYIFTANFFKRAAFKFAFVQIPMAFAIPVLTVLALSPQRKRHIKKRLSIIRYRITRVYRRLLRWYERWFGHSAVLVFIMSCVFAGLTFVFFMWQFSFEFFIWLGSWSWVSSSFRAIGSFFSPLFSWTGGMVRGVIFRFPMVGTVIAFFGTLWRERVARLIPGVESRRKRVVKGSLRAARNTRQHSLGVYMRWARRRERRKERARERRRLRTQRKQLEHMQQLMWLPESRPYWNRRGVRFNDQGPLIDRATFYSHERLRFQAGLGGSIHGSML